MPTKREMLVVDPKKKKKERAALCNQVCRFAFSSRTSKGIAATNIFHIKRKANGQKIKIKNLSTEKKNTKHSDKAWIPLIKIKILCLQGLN